MESVDISNPPLMWQAMAKAQFAHQGIHAAERILAQYLSNNGVRLERQFEESSGTHFLDLVADPMHVDVALAVGTAAHTLRSALDTAIHTLLERAKGKIRKSRIGFPSHETEEQLRATFENGSRTCPKCGEIATSKGMYADIREFIPELEDLIFSEFKPWGKTSPLWQLGRLDNLDKHRMIFPALGQVVWQGSHSSKDALGGGVFSLYNTYTMYPGARLTLAHGCEPVTIIENGHFSATLVFPEEVPFGGEPVIETLKELVKLVTGVIETLQTHFQRS